MTYFEYTKVITCQMLMWPARHNETQMAKKWSMDLQLGPRPTWFISMTLRAQSDDDHHHHHPNQWPLVRLTQPTNQPTTSASSDQRERDAHYIALDQLTKVSDLNRRRQCRSWCQRSYLTTIILRVHLGNWFLLGGREARWCDVSSRRFRSAIWDPVRTCDLFSGALAFSFWPYASKIRCAFGVLHRNDIMRFMNQNRILTAPAASSLPHWAFLFGLFLPLANNIQSQIFILIIFYPQFLSKKFNYSNNH